MCDDNPGFRVSEIRVWNIMTASEQRGAAAAPVQQSFPDELCVLIHIYICVCIHKGSEHRRQRLTAVAPGPHAMALRGRGVAQQNRGSSGEGIWIIKPIAGNLMAIMGAKVPL